jgi:hypothetical protein
MALHAAIYFVFISIPALLKDWTEIKIWCPMQNKGYLCPACFLCTELLSTYLMIQIDHVFFQRHIRVHIICCVTGGAASRWIETGAPVQLTGTHNSSSDSGRYNKARPLLSAKSVPNMEEFPLSVFTADNRHTHIRKCRHYRTFSVDYANPPRGLPP